MSFVHQLSELLSAENHDVDGMEATYSSILKVDQ